MGYEESDSQPLINDSALEMNKSAKGTEGVIITDENVASVIDELVGDLYLPSATEIAARKREEKK